MLSLNTEKLLAQFTLKFPVPPDEAQGPVSSKIILQHLQKKEVLLFIKKHGLQNSIKKYLMQENILSINSLFHSIAEQFMEKLHSINRNINQINFQDVYLHMRTILIKKGLSKQLIPFQMNNKHLCQDLMNQLLQLFKWTFRQLLITYQMINFASKDCCESQIKVLMNRYQAILANLLMNPQNILNSIQKAQMKIHQSFIMINQQHIKVQPKHQQQNVTAAKNHHHIGKPYQIKKDISIKDAINYALGLKLSEDLLKHLHSQFTKKERHILEQSINKVIKQWQKADVLITGNKPLARSNKQIALKCCKRLLTVINSIHFVEENKSERNLRKIVQLAGLFYFILSQQKHHIALRFLQKLCKNIEKSFEFYQLRKIVSIFQNHHFKADKLTTQLQLLYQQMPLRSASFNESMQSIFHKNNGFANHRQSQGLVMHNYQNLSKSIKLVRLNYCKKPSKNIIILISGFLSQYSEKDCQWQDIIHAHKHTQIFGLIWPSSSLADVGKFVADLAVQVVARVTLVGKIVQFGKNIFNPADRKQTKNISNPFSEALKNTESTGRLLAECLINNFRDRKVTLAGFSMGTEVIYRCISQLAKRKKMSMINKVVTIGGIAKKQQVQGLLQENCQVGLRWINFWSKNDFTVCKDLLADLQLWKCSWSWSDSERSWA